MKLKHLILISGLSIPNILCSSSKYVHGHYVSNFPASGFFVTDLKLRKDSTFIWMLYGDLMADSASGIYRKNRDKLFLFFNPTVIVPDSFELSYLKEHNLPLSTLELLKLPRPHGFKVKKKKLFFIDSTGQIERKLWNQNAGKKMKYYLLLQ